MSETTNDAVDWNEAEREALDALPRERPLTRTMEDDAVRRLEREGILGRPRARGWWIFTGPRLAWTAAAASALVAVYFAGFAAGQRSAVRATAEAFVALHEDDARQAEIRVQQTGSAYVAALATLARMAADEQSPDLTQGREVAVAALYAAAEQLVRFDPNDPVAARLLVGLQRTERPSDFGPKSVIWN